MHDGWSANDPGACHKHFLLFHDNFHSGKATSTHLILIAPPSWFLMLSTKQIRHLNETMLKVEAIPHPGIGPVMPNDEIRHHAYYQWVPFVLFAQAICFYIPHLLWRAWENGKIKSLVIGLQAILLSKFLPSEEDLEINKTYVIYSKPTLDKKV